MIRSIWYARMLQSGKKYVKAPDINYTAEDWKECQETVAGIDRNETMVTAMVAPGVLRCAIISVRSRIL